MSRRVFCRGALGRACPAHAWWYAEGRARPKERCPLCWPVHEEARRRENHRNDDWKRRQLRAAALALGEGD